MARSILLPDDHGGASRFETVQAPGVREKIGQLLGAPFDTVVSRELLDACGIQEVADYRVIPAMAVRTDRHEDGAVHNTLASDAYLPTDHVRGPVLLIGLDQGASDDDSMFVDVPQRLVERWSAPPARDESDRPIGEIDT